MDEEEITEEDTPPIMVKLVKEEEKPKEEEYEDAPEYHEVKVSKEEIEEVEIE